MDSTIQQEQQQHLEASSSTSTTSSSDREEHPLQTTPSILVENESIIDDRTLLDDQGRPNISRAPSVVIETDSDTSHTKVYLFFNLNS